MFRLQRTDIRGHSTNPRSPEASRGKEGDEIDKSESPAQLIYETALSFASSAALTLTCESIGASRSPSIDAASF